MRRYLVDTSPLAAFLLVRRGPVALLGPWIEHDELAASVLVYGEVSEYLMGRSDFTERDAHLRQLLKSITPYFLTYSTLRRYAIIMRQHRAPHGAGLIGDIDTLIVATALERGLTVVTTDGDYTRVPSLTVILLDRESLAGQ